MPTSKNLSPQQLSALTALALAIPISLGIFIFKPVWWIALLSFGVIFLGSYGLILYTLQNFIIKIFYPKKVLMKLEKMWKPGQSNVKQR